MLRGFKFCLDDGWSVCFVVNMFTVAALGVVSLTYKTSLFLLNLFHLYIYRDKFSKVNRSKSSSQNMLTTFSAGED